MTFVAQPMEGVELENTTEQTVVSEPALGDLRKMRRLHMLNHTNVKLQVEVALVTTAELAALFVAANSEFLDVADNAELSATTDLTVSVWFRPDSVGARQMVASKHDDGAQGAWALSMESDGKLRVNIATLLTDAIDTQHYTSSVVLTVGTWYHIVVQYDGGGAANADRLKLWINDVEDAAGAFVGTIPVTMPAEAAAFMLGAFDLGAAAFADGRISRAVMWKRTLGAGEKSFMHNAGLGRAYSEASTALKVSMVSWWALLEKSGQRDDSHSTNHLSDNASVLIADSMRLPKVPREILHQARMNTGSDWSLPDPDKVILNERQSIVARVHSTVPSGTRVAVSSEFSDRTI